MGNHLTRRQLSNIDRGFAAGKPAPASGFAPSKPRPFYNEAATILCMNMLPENISGFDLLDLSPSKNHGDIGGCLQRYGGPFGKNLRVTQNCLGIVLSTGILLNSGGNWTVEGWMRSLDAGSNTLLSNDSGGPVSNQLRVYNNKIEYRHYDGAWLAKTGATVLTNTDWYYLVWVNHSNETMDMYINAAAELTGVGSTQSSPTANGTVDNIGRYVDDEGEANIAGVRITRRSKTAEEIHDYYYGINGL